MSGHSAKDLEVIFNSASEEARLHPHRAPLGQTGDTSDPCSTFVRIED